MFYFEVFKKIRKEKKITIEQIAKHLNKTRGTVSSWEKGIYQPCDSDIKIMAQFLNAPVQIISDLQEIITSNNQVKEQDFSSLDIKGLSPETALKLKTLHDCCLDLRATNTKLRMDVFKYRVLIQSLPILIYVKDKNLKYTYANDQFINLIGGMYSKYTISGTVSSNIFGIKEYFPILSLEQKVLQTKRRISNQQICIPGTFEKKIGLLTIIPILNDEKSIERITCSIEDITDYSVEASRRKVLEEVINELPYMILIGEKSADDDTFIYTYISDSIFDIYGLTKDEVFENNNAWLEIIHDNDIERVKEWKKANTFPKKIKYRINHPEKGVRWISSKMFKEGESRIYGIMTDITEEEEVNLGRLKDSKGE